MLFPLLLTGLFVCLEQPKQHEMIFSKPVATLGSLQIPQGTSGTYLFPKCDFFLCHGQQKSNPEQVFVSICEIDSGKVVLTIDINVDASPICFAASPKAPLLAVSGFDGSIVIWNYATQQKVQEIRREKEDAASRLEFSSSGTYLVSAGEKTLRVWDLLKNKELYQRQLQTSIASLAAHPNQDIVLFGDQGGVIRWFNLQTGQFDKAVEFFPVRAANLITHPSNSVDYLTIAPDGKLLITQSFDREYVLWALDRDQEIARPKLSPRGVKCFRFSPDSQVLLFLDRDEVLRRCEAATGKDIKVVVEKLPDPLYSGKAAFSADGKQIYSLTTTVRRWDLATGRELTPKDQHHGELTAIASLPQQDLLATGSKDSTVRLWNLKTGERLATLEDRMGEVTSLAFLRSNKRLAVGSSDATVRIWEGGKVVNRLEGHQGPVLALAATPDGNTLVSAGQDASLRIWKGPNWEAGKAKATSARARQLFLSDDGRRVASLAENRQLLLWDVGQDTTTTFTPEGDKLQAAALSPSGHLLAGIGSHIYLWDTESRQLLTQFAPHESIGRHAVKFLTDRLLVTTGPDRATLIDWPTAQVESVRRFDSHLGGMDVSAYPHRLYTAHHDTLACVWDLDGHAKAISQRLASPLRREIRANWEQLASPKATDAVWGLYNLLLDRSAIQFLETRLKPVHPVAELQVQAEIDRLEDDAFSVREKAFMRLQEWSESALPILRKRLNEKPTQELRSKLEDLIARAVETTPERLGQIRSVLAVEYMGTPAAREFLSNLAKGTPAARLTRDAIAAMKRMEARDKP